METIPGEYDMKPQKYVPKYLHKLNEEQTQLLCIENDFSVSVPTQIQFDTIWRLRIQVEEHYNETHLIEPTEPLIRAWLAKNTPIFGKYNLMQRIIDDCGFKFWYWRNWGEEIRYNTEIAKIVNRLRKASELTGSRKGSGYEFRYIPPLADPQ